MFGGYQRRLRIWETDDGREAGWIAERDGRPVAVLTEPRLEEMFWDSYRVELVAEDPHQKALMSTEAFWSENGWEGLVFRNREFGDVAEFAFPAREPFLLTAAQFAQLFRSDAASIQAIDMVMSLRKLRRDQ